MLLYGIAAVAVLWFLLSNFAQANTAAIARFMTVGGGLLALGAAAVLGLRGRIDMAILLGSLGAWLLGWNGFKLSGFGGSAKKGPGRVSRVRSILIEMDLDHDTGEMNGSILGGTFAGQKLHALDEAGLQHILEECRAGDPDGVRLLEAYLDRRFTHWRESAQDEEQKQSGARSSSATMTEEEAYQILGIRPGSSPDEVRHAHRTLMKKLHPDQGGSTYLAARVNQAKEILTSRKR